MERVIVHFIRQSDQVRKATVLGTRVEVRGIISVFCLQWLEIRMHTGQGLLSLCWISSQHTSSVTAYEVESVASLAETAFGTSVANYNETENHRQSQDCSRSLSLKTHESASKMTESIWQDETQPNIQIQVHVHVVANSTDNMTSVCYKSKVLILKKHYWIYLWI